MRYPFELLLVKRPRVRTVVSMVAAVAALAAGGTAGAYDFAAPPPGLAATDFNTFKFYLGDQETYDDNLFRLPPGTVGVPGAVIPNATQSDSVNTASVGGQGKWSLARQEFEVNARADENRFAHNSSLNYVSSNAVGLWNWRAGPYFTGQLEAFYDRSLASFGQTRFSGKDIVSSNEELGSARYQAGPHWAVYGQLRGSYTQHSEAVEQFNNFHNKSGNAGVEYATDVNDTFGFQYQYVDITFNQSVAVTTRAFDYSENNGRFLAHYGISGKVVLDAYAGYLRRQYPGSNIGAFSGEIWRAAFTYAYTDKTQFIFSAYHELHAYIDAESNYFVAKGVSLSPVWLATEKLSFTLLAAYENQDYISSSNTVLLVAPRTAKVNSDQLTVKYVPRDALTLTLFARHEKRDSNQFGFEYNDTLVSGSVTFQFK